MADAPTDTDRLELATTELAVVLGALRTAAWATRARAAGAYEEHERRRLTRRVDDLERLRHAVVRACGPITTTTTLCLPRGDRLALAEILDRHLAAATQTRQLARRLTR